MAISDALYVVDDWISEHYFVSDDKSGTFAARAKELLDAWRKESAEEPEYTSPRERFTARNAALTSQMLDLQAEESALPATARPRERRRLLGERSEQMADLLRWVLGYTDDKGAADQWDVVRRGPLRLFATRGVDETPLAMLDALAAGDLEDVLSKQAGFLPADVVLDEDTDAERTLTSVPQVLSALALEPSPPEFMLVLAGRFAVLTSADLWPQGRYLAADLQTIAERNDLKRGGEVERMLACFSADSLAPDASSQIWWSTTREQAVANAVGVSEDLRDGVRESIEIIANDVLRRRRRDGGPGELPGDQAQVLALQSLRYLYRILFLLYAEASPELGVLPVNAPEYQQGYSVGRLRELVEKDVPLEAVEGTYFYDSLENLFRLVNSGHGEASPEGDDAAGEDLPAEHGDGTLLFESLEADLFDPCRTHLLNEVGIGNAALKDVLERLLLSREKKGKARGAISYVALGINQLGAVYESLMSYTGSIATEELVEVAKNGNADGGSWVVPADTLDESLLGHRVMVPGEDGEPVPRTYRHGEFVFRLSGRARQQSASYYSPEVITRFTVSQGLAELLDPVVEDESDLPEGAEVFDDEDFDHQPIRRRRTTAEEILGMTICEPALGSGAFAIEAVRQLADEYLTRRQQELGKRIDPEHYATEVQRVKAYIALHNVYGVDLNATAVELAEVSLWLDTMAPGLKAPWFGLRLRAGNSLIGARHATYTSASLGKAKLRDVVVTAPAPLPVSTVREKFSSSAKRPSLYRRVFHFLLPGEGWFAAAQDAEIKKLAPEEAKTLRDHAKLFQGKLTADELDRLLVLTQRAEELWGFALRRLELAEENTRRAIPVWEAGTAEGGAVTRTEVEQSLADTNSAYRRLRLVMDAWCALWFWPVVPDDDVKPPTFCQWLDTLEKIFGRTLEVVRGGPGSALHGAGQTIMGSAEGWDELNVIESMFGVSGAANIDQLTAQTPWLKRCVEIATEQRFFHWELDFAAAFDRGGFDLQVGNPPWVQPKISQTSIYADFDPWWMIGATGDAVEKRKRRAELVESDNVRVRLLCENAAANGMQNYLGAQSLYEALRGVDTDLYRNFVVLTWANMEAQGISALVHPSAHLAALSGGELRKLSYRRLRRLWAFWNEEKLFSEIGNKRPYAVNVYGGEGPTSFLLCTDQYHPSTIVGSLVHDGTGEPPRARRLDGARDTRPHRSRISKVTPAVLASWSALYSGSMESVQTNSPPLLSGVDSQMLRVLRRFASSNRYDPSDLTIDRGIDGSRELDGGGVTRAWGEAGNPGETILSGPNFYIGNPLFQDRARSMGSHRDYVRVNLEQISEAAGAVTEYKPIVADSLRPEGEGYKIVYRERIDVTGVRSFIPTLVSSRVRHLNTVHSVRLKEVGSREIALLAAEGSTLLVDALFRAVSAGHVTVETLALLPRIDAGSDFAQWILLRYLRLNCLTLDYSTLWSDCYSRSFESDSWCDEPAAEGFSALGDIGPVWGWKTPLRREEERRKAEVEIDALMAIALGVSVDDLVHVYWSRFGTLSSYDAGQGQGAQVFDRHGRRVESSVRKKWAFNAAGIEIPLSQADRTAELKSEAREVSTRVFEQPFRVLDREADMRQAYAEFTRRMEENPS